jgi:hypothetical protein
MEKDAPYAFAGGAGPSEPGNLGLGPVGGRDALMAWRRLAPIGTPGRSVDGCQASWFVATFYPNATTLPLTLAPGASSPTSTPFMKVGVAMVESGTNQNACAGLELVRELSTLPSSHLDLLRGVVPHIMVVRLTGSGPRGLNPSSAASTTRLHRRSGYEDGGATSARMAAASPAGGRMTRISRSATSIRGRRSPFSSEHRGTAPHGVGLGEPRAMGSGSRGALHQLAPVADAPVSRTAGGCRRSGKTGQG